MKIGKKTREDAITLCLLRADCWTRPGAVRSLYDESDDIGAGTLATMLTCITFASVPADYEIDSLSQLVAVRYLEAAALLRDGWCPGDPVVRRGK